MAKLTTSTAHRQPSPLLAALVFAAIKLGLTHSPYVETESMPLPEVPK